VVDILLYSLEEGSHPFHLHGHEFVRQPPPIPACPSRSPYPSARASHNRTQQLTDKTTNSGSSKPARAPSTGRTTTRRSTRPAHPATPTPSAATPSRCSLTSGP
jgi:hypothetical protein